MLREPSISVHHTGDMIHRNPLMEVQIEMRTILCGQHGLYQAFLLDLPLPSQRGTGPGPWRHSGLRKSR